MNQTWNHISHQQQMEQYNVICNGVSNIRPTAEAQNTSLQTIQINRNSDVSAKVAVFLSHWQHCNQKCEEHFLPQEWSYIQNISCHRSDPISRTFPATGVILYPEHSLPQEWSYIQNISCHRSDLISRTFPATRVILYPEHLLPQEWS
jgi:hypothetical protein